MNMNVKGEETLKRKVLVNIWVVILLVLESIWGQPFKDEQHSEVVHSGRGVVTCQYWKQWVLTTLEIMEEGKPNRL
ncbi:hypothetical protein FRX31_028889 [Thalictrum thalictroides]|uniref:Uncharacterized protein n=1 Tax=Thalictrum thalictroides TaxID=46969 RepID=A0A7J6V989_THATH|nr:hypothetical protein FRX31_028889 [Thalictrum thalictroides]